jgi:hypothetical protein
VSFDLKLIENSPVKPGQILPVFPASPEAARRIGTYPRLDGGTDHGDYMEAAMTAA